MYTEIDEAFRERLNEQGLVLARMNQDESLLSILSRCRRMQRDGIYLAAQIEALAPTGRRSSFLGYQVRFPPLLQALCSSEAVRLVTIEAKILGDRTEHAFDLHSGRDAAISARRALERSIIADPMHHDWASSEVLLSDPVARALSLTFIGQALEYLGLQR